jgi:acyl-CoA synthetase (AMP-forming)/AMP-acid ligase II
VGGVEDRVGDGFGGVDEAGGDGAALGVGLGDGQEGLRVEAEAAQELGREPEVLGGVGGQAFPGDCFLGDAAGEQDVDDGVGLGEVKDRYDRSSMRVMIANAAPWSYALKQRYLADFPPESLFEVYGSTELGVDTVLLPQDQLGKPGSCGQPAPFIEIRLVGEDGNEVSGTGPDHPGEVFVRSRAAFDTYYKNEVSYASNSRGDFHTVGDIGYWDDEGYLYICDRKSDMIISGGMNIYPAEIEAALDQHPEIYDVAAFGVPSEEWGEVVHATVVRTPGSALTGEEIMAFAREQLASYKVPRSVDFTGELPRTGSGKILKRQLRAPYWAGHTTQVG